MKPLPRTTLVRVPTPELAEAPSSWLSRLAVHQNAVISEVMAFFGLATDVHLDIAFARADVRWIERCVDVSLAPIYLSVHILRSVDKIDPGGRRLLYGGDARGAFRYCPQCLIEQRSPHVPVHWRITTYRHCDEHGVLLDIHCGQCGSPTFLPRSLLTAGSSTIGVAALDRCLRCGARLSSREPCRTGAPEAGLLTSTEWAMLSNGRACVAALALREGRFLHEPDQFGLDRLWRLIRSGLVPSALGWLDADEVRHRSQPPESCHTTRSSERPDESTTHAVRID